MTPADLPPLWTDLIRTTRRSPVGPLVVGIFEGEGVGPEVIGAARSVLSAIADACGLAFDVRAGGAIGRLAEAESGVVLTREVVAQCEEVFAAGGAVLAGPGGGRFVYELRTQFDLFAKLSPIVPCAALRSITRGGRAHIDVLVVRENVGGVYQGKWTEESSAGGRTARQSFSYAERDVERITRAAAAIAAGRRGRLAVVTKPDGLPTVSRLWIDCAEAAATAAGVALTALDADYATYALIQHAEDLDVIVAPNLFGDILSDAGAVLLGSRALSFGGSFAVGGAAVYQTNHGSAHDLARTDRANPAGQILALAMMLRESFGLRRQARLVEQALASVWRSGVRTADLAEAGCAIVGTREVCERVAAAVRDVKRRERT